MALISCKHCGGKLSDKAKRCPHCGKSGKSRILSSLKICLLCIFGTQALALLLSLILYLSFNHIFYWVGVSISTIDHIFYWDRYSINNVVTFLSSVIIACSLGFILAKNLSQIKLFGKIGAISAFLIYAFFVFDDIFLFLDLKALIPINILSLISISLLLYNIKISKYIQLFGVISYIPFIIISILACYPLDQIDYRAYIYGGQIAMSMGVIGLLGLLLKIVVSIMLVKSLKCEKTAL